MALQLSYQTASGVVLPTAYARVGKLMVENPTQGGGNVSFDLELYAGQDAREAGKQPVWGPQGYTFWLGVPPATPAEEPQAYYLNKALGEVVITDAYAYLKTRAEFQGASDV